MSSIETRPCEHCGDSYPPSHPVQRYCSNKCKVRQRTKVKAEERRRRRAAVLSDCLQCGASLVKAKRTDAKFCSDKCYRKQPHVQEQRRQRYRKNTGGVVTKSCEVCSTPFSGLAKSMTHRKFCSRRCKVDGRLAQERASLIVAKSERDRKCPHCGTAVAPEKNASAVYCSPACSKAAHHATSKARMKIRVGGAVERIPRAYIIERDNSRCHICRKKCRSSEIHIDHVIPLSKGGTHTLENLRVAHAKCNMAKGARACNEQLMLVG